MADSISKFISSSINSAKQDFNSQPLVQAIKNFNETPEGADFKSIAGEEDRYFDRAGKMSLNNFIDRISEYGTLVKAKYEVTFSGIDDLTFFVTDINVPSLRRNFGTLHYHGQTIEIPITIEYEHDFNMIIINDGQGTLYPTFMNLLLNMREKAAVDSGYELTLRMIGDGINTPGIAIVFYGVRFKSISGITANSGDSGISTFTVGCTAIRYDVFSESVNTNLLNSTGKSNIMSREIKNKIPGYDKVMKIGKALA